MRYADLPKDDRVSFRIPVTLKNQLTKLAAGDNRKLGDYMFLLLAKHAEETQQELLAAEDPADYGSMLPPPTLAPLKKAKKNA